MCPGGGGGGADRVTDTAPPVARQLSSSFNSIPGPESPGGLEF